MEKIIDVIEKIDIKDIESENVISVSNRTLPLEECGLIMTIIVGVKGLSIAQAEKYMSEMIQYYTDDGIIKNKVKFYKEYWFVSSEHNTVTIDCKII